jgi:hypothetical protein
MSDPTTPRPWITTLTRRRLATAGIHPYYRYGFHPAAAPCLVIAAPRTTDLAESLI